MTENRDRIRVLKNTVVIETFLNTADQNYLIARWAYHRGMFNDFFWNSVHAVEKYLKASLLLNDRSGKRDKNGKAYGHDLVRLFEAVYEYAGDLIPDSLEQPKQLKGIPWSNETFVDFVARLNELGDANNRYNIYGYSQRWEDLSHLDQAVFSFRRIACRLDAWPFNCRPSPDGQLPETVREMLMQDPKFMPHGIGSRLFELLGRQGDDELRDAGLKANFVFAPDDYDHRLDQLKIGTSSTSSVLYRRIVEVAGYNSPNSADRDAADLADWVIENIFLPSGDREELLRCRDVLRARIF